MANVIILDPKYTIDLALDNYVSESEEIESYELVGDALVEENGDISCGEKFDNDSNVYTVVLHTTVASTSTNRRNREMENISIERSFEIGTHYRPELIYKADPYLEIGIVKLESFLDGETFYRAYVNEDTENPIEGLTIKEALEGVMMENNLTMDDLHLVYKREDSNV